MASTSQLLTSGQVAAELGCSSRTVNRLIERGELEPAVKVDGGRRGRAYGYLFDPRDVELYKLRRSKGAA